MEFTIRQIAEILDGEIEGEAEALINSFAKIEEGQPGSISFLANPKYEDYIYTTGSSAVIVADNFVPKKDFQTNLIKVKDPYLAISHLMKLYQESLKSKRTGVSKQAIIGVNSILGEEVFIDSFSQIGEDCKIGDRVDIASNVFIGNKVEIGNDTIIHPGVIIKDGCKIGSNSEIHPGAVIGSDGFGFAPDSQGVYHNVPQLGNVVLGDYVSIGANTTIDRATLGSTRIGNGVKIDNLVQIGHNVEVGDHTVIAAQTGVSGSTKIGKNCIIAGQVGFVGHLTIADGTKIGAQSGVAKSIREPGGAYSGHPLMPIKQYLRLMIKLSRLK